MFELRRSSTFSTRTQFLEDFKPLMLLGKKNRNPLKHVKQHPLFKNKSTFQSDIFIRVQLDCSDTRLGDISLKKLE